MKYNGITYFGRNESVHAYPQRRIRRLKRSIGVRLAEHAFRMSYYRISGSISARKTMIIIDDEIS
jgi:hypothetical protein